ncbi:MAG: phage tail sheath subtilisin-like domain-containing protein [Oceanospirillaceae bacterium]|nr:phage tail sheath subtilisin-like domain-containing protein [Oceanospirillaceae bacterium]
MAASFLHGVEILELDTATHPIKTVRSSVIGLVGTAPDADAAAFPLNTPVLIAGSEIEAAKLDTVGDKNGTLPDAVDGIFDNAGALIVVVRVDEGADNDATISNIIGGVDGVTGARTGVHTLLNAQSELGVTPKILIAPSFSGHVTRDGSDVIEGAPVATELDIVAEKLRGIVIAEGPNTTDADAIAFEALFGSERVYVVDPAVKVWDTVADAPAVESSSARVAGVFVLNDLERGYHVSPSNREIKGIIGTARPIDFVLGDANARANLLNENNIATIINQDGYRLWGNHTCSSDQKWTFISHVRLNDVILESLLQAHLWAVDRNIDKNYIEQVTEGVNAFLRSLATRGIISGGKCWAMPDLNTKESMDAGQVYFDFDYGRYGTAERVTFRANVNNDYTVNAVFG